MKAFTTEELVRIRDSKFFITKERFVEYSILQFGHTEREAVSLYEEFYKFPFIHSMSERPLEIASWISNHIEKCNPSRHSIKTNESNDIWVKAIYELNGENYESEFNLITPEGAIKYSMLYSNDDVEIKAVVKKVDEDYVKSKTIRVYEGDTYHTHDEFWQSKKGNVYSVINGNIKRLLYIKGKGYVLNGKPNIDGESNYSTYAMLFKNTQYMGNINVDSNFLKDE